MDGRDPWSELGLSPGASADDVRARYVELVKRHPPDRDPAAFERIRDAFEAASDPRWRARERILGPPPLTDPDELASLLAGRPRSPAGPEAWLAALREARR